MRSVKTLCREAPPKVFHALDQRSQKNDSALYTANVHPVETSQQRQEWKENGRNRWVTRRVFAFTSLQSISKLDSNPDVINGNTYIQTPGSPATVHIPGHRNQDTMDTAPCGKSGSMVRRKPNSQTQRRASGQAWSDKPKEAGGWSHSCVGCPRLHKLHTCSSHTAEVLPANLRGPCP